MLPSSPEIQLVSMLQAQLIRAPENVLAGFSVCFPAYQRLCWPALRFCNPAPLSLCFSVPRSNHQSLFVLQQRPSNQLPLLLHWRSGRQVSPTPPALLFGSQFVIGRLFCSPVGGLCSCFPDLDFGHVVRPPERFCLCCLWTCSVFLFSPLTIHLRHQLLRYLPLDPSSGPLSSTQFDLDFFPPAI